MKDNKPICESYVSAMNAMRHSTIYDAVGQEGGLSGGSTDMGELSLLESQRKHHSRSQGTYRTKSPASMADSISKPMGSIIHLSSLLAPDPRKISGEACIVQQEWQLWDVSS